MDEIKLEDKEIEFLFKAQSTEQFACDYNTKKLYNLGLIEPEEGHEEACKTFFEGKFVPLAKVRFKTTPKGAVLIHNLSRKDERKARRNSNVTLPKLGRIKDDRDIAVGDWILMQVYDRQSYRHDVERKKGSIYFEDEDYITECTPGETKLAQVLWNMDSNYKTIFHLSEIHTGQILFSSRTLKGIQDYIDTDYLHVYWRILDEGENFTVEVKGKRK